MDDTTPEMIVERKTQRKGLGQHVVKKMKRRSRSLSCCNANPQAAESLITSEKRDAIWLPPPPARPSSQMSPPSRPPPSSRPPPPSRSTIIVHQPSNAPEKRDVGVAHSSQQPSQTHVVQPPEASAAQTSPTRPQIEWGIELDSKSVPAPSLRAESNADLKQANQQEQHHQHVVSRPHAGSSPDHDQSSNPQRSERNIRKETTHQTIEKAQAADAAQMHQEEAIGIHRRSQKFMSDAMEGIGDASIEKNSEGSSRRRTETRRPPVPRQQKVTTTARRLAGLPPARERQPDGLVHAKDAGLSQLIAKAEAVVRNAFKEPAAQQCNTSGNKAETAAVGKNWIAPERWMEWREAVDAKVARRTAELHAAPPTPVPKNAFSRRRSPQKSVSPAQTADHQATANAFSLGTAEAPMGGRSIAGKQDFLARQEADRYARAAREAAAAEARRAAPNVSPFSQASNSAVPKTLEALHSEAAFRAQKRYELAKKEADRKAAEAEAELRPTPKLPSSSRRLAAARKKRPAPAPAPPPEPEPSAGAGKRTSTKALTNLAAISPRRYRPKSTTKASSTGDPVRKWPDKGSSKGSLNERRRTETRGGRVREVKMQANRSRSDRKSRRDELLKLSWLALRTQALVTGKVLEVQIDEIEDQLEHGLTVEAAKSQLVALYEGHMKSNTNCSALGAGVNSQFSASGAWSGSSEDEMRLEDGHIIDDHDLTGAHQAGTCAPDLLDDLAAAASKDTLLRSSLMKAQKAREPKISQQTQAKGITDQAMTAFAASNYSEAVRLLQTALDLYPADKELQAGLKFAMSQLQASGGMPTPVLKPSASVSIGTNQSLRSKGEAPWRRWAGEDSDDDKGR